MTQTDQFVRLPDVIRLTGLSRSSVYARLNPRAPASFDPTFPRPIKLSPGPKGASAWSLLELKVWMEARLQARSVP